MKEEARPANSLWRVRLFEGPTLESAGGELLCRFRSHKVGALLAYLALHLGRACPREELYLALWPEENDAAVVANRLRVTLASLRRQLEPTSVMYGTVLDVSAPGRVRLRAETVWCDVMALERAVKSGNFGEVADLAHGTLLPGFYEDWALTARRHVQTLRETWKPVQALLPSEPMGTEKLRARDRTGKHKAQVRTGEGEAAIGAAGGGTTERPCPAIVPSAAESLPGTGRRETSTPTHLPLPIYLTRFFGREAEQERLLSLLAEGRLVTLTGPGGIGKTRLCVEIADKTSWTSIFVSLSELMEPDRLADTILRALLISTRPEVDPEQHLVERLHSRAPLLLILDNAEHLLDAVADLSLRLLHAVPGLRLLITSRQRLNVAGECAFALPPLELPSSHATPEYLLTLPCAALFVDRARNARPDFALAPRHADALAEICRRVEGMPLALELAAARISTQTPTQIAHSLHAGLLHLKSQQRGLSKRHQSLRAAIQGSYELLSPPLQVFFARLSVFQGGWTLEAACEVTGCAEAEEFLEELAQRSLIVTREAEQTDMMRCGFLETIRQFAAEQLSAAERAERTQSHAAYFLGLAAQMWTDDVRLLRRLDGELENLLLALETGRERSGDTYGWGLAGALMYMFVRGLHRIGVFWTETARDLAEGVENLALRLRLRFAACMIFADVGRLEETRRIAEQAQQEALAGNDALGAVAAATYVGYAANELGDLASAVEIQRAALHQARSLNHAPTLHRCLTLTARALLGYTAIPDLEPDVSQAACHECEMLARECLDLLPPYSRLIALVQLALGLALREQGRSEESYAFLKRAQQTALSHGSQALLMYGFYHESIAARAQGCWKYAALLHGAFLNLQERMGYSLAMAAPMTERFRAELVAQLGTEVYETLVQRGRQTPAGELITHSLNSPPDENSL